MAKLLDELKRRKVFRVAAVYAVVAWVLIQVADVVLPTFGAPEWVSQTIIFLFVLGFVPTLIAAWAYEITPEGIKPDFATQSLPSTTNNNDRKLIYATFILVLLAVGFQVVDRFLYTNQQATVEVATPESSTQDSRVMHLTVPLSESSDLFLGGGPQGGVQRPSSTSIALSNDGNLLVFSAWEEGSDPVSDSRLYIRRLDQESAQVIEGTEGASVPFFSPDNAWIGFFAGTSLKRIPVTGGTAQTVVEDSESLAFGMRGASWGDDGSIVYADYAPGVMRSNSTAPESALYRVAATGGDKELLADPRLSMGQFNRFGQPQILPGSEVVLFQGLSTTYDPERTEIIAVDLATGTQTSLLTNAMNPRYIAETGHLLFMRRGSLMAVSFDPENLLLQGEPVTVVEDVMQALNMPNTSWNTGVSQVAISSAGHLVYVRNVETPEGFNMLARLTLDGEAEPLNTTSQSNYNFRTPKLSPEGERLIFTSGEGAGRSIYLHDLVRDVTQRLNTGGYTNYGPIWSPDGESIAFSSNREDGTMNIYRIAADGGSERPERLAPSEGFQMMQSWSADGTIAFIESNDIWVLPPGGESTRFFASDSVEDQASFSPNGEWLAYVSSESLDDSKIYIRSYPGAGPAILISGSFSGSPAWSNDGTQLYFLDRGENRNGETARMMVVDLTEGNPSVARPLIDPWLYGYSTPVRSYDVLQNGSFIVRMREGLQGDELVNRQNQISERNQINELKLILNFFNVLR